jgi:hypothetical protein
MAAISLPFCLQFRASQKPITAAKTAYLIGFSYDFAEYEGDVYED